MSQSGRAVLRVSGVHKSFAAAGGTTVALNGVDLDIEARKFRIDHRAVRLRQVHVAADHGGARDRRRRAKSFTNKAACRIRRRTWCMCSSNTRARCFPWKTVERNVAFGLENKGTMSRAEIAARTREMIGLVKLTGFERHYPWQLSGGMQQRVAIARALACRPAVLLMDEPFSAVDALTRAGLQELLRSLWRELNLTVIFVTHDVDEGVYLSTRVVALTRVRPAPSPSTFRSNFRRRATRSRPARCPPISTIARGCSPSFSPTRASKSTEAA